ECRSETRSRQGSAATVGSLNRSTTWSRRTTKRTYEERSTWSSNEARRLASRRDRQITSRGTCGGSSIVRLTAAACLCMLRTGAEEWTGAFDISRARFSAVQEQAQALDTCVAKR